MAEHDQQFRFFVRRPEGRPERKPYTFTVDTRFFVECERPISEALYAALGFPPEAQPDIIASTPGSLLEPVILTVAANAEPVEPEGGYQKGVRRVVDSPLWFRRPTIRAANFEVTPAALRDLLRTGTHHSFDVLAGIPRDGRILGATYDVYRAAYILTVQSAEFPEVCEGDELPRRVFVFHRRFPWTVRLRDWLRARRWRRDGGTR